MNRITQGRSFLLTLTIVVLTLSGCASVPKIYTSANPAVDLREYKTFAFSNQLATDRGRETRSILSTHLINATKEQMAQRGYQYEQVNPDLEINFYLHTRQKIRATSTPTGGGYYGFRRGYYGAWRGYETTVTQYKEGTLTIDLVDTHAKVLAWEGTAIGTLTEKERKTPETTVPRIVGLVFNDFPDAS